MSDKRLVDKRVLLTQAEDYMGPDTIELFTEHGAEVIADNSDLTQPGAVEPENHKPPPPALSATAHHLELAD